MVLCFHLIYLSNCSHICCRENFLQVDIFYQELSYEMVEQQPAFELLSLLSEVGGFLGLLLGASVITVLEMIGKSFKFISNAFNNMVASGAE